MKLKACLTILLLVTIAGFAAAQTGDRYALNSAQDISVIGGAVGYQPNVATVSDGIISDLRPTVSADLRYVQINVGIGNANIIRIDNFQVVTD